MKHFDVAIIGGGLVGAALACALQKLSAAKKNILLIDATSLNTVEDHRLIALNHTSHSVLNELELWSEISAHATSIQEVHVSNQGQFGITRLNAKELNLNSLGFVVPAKIITAALYKRLEKLEQLTWLRPSALTDLTQNNSEVTLQIADKTFTAETVIAADGTHSTVRQLLNIPTEIIDYQQQALVTVSDLQRSHRNIAYERFHATGAIAMLPLAENQVATIWTDSEKNILALMQLDSSEFLFHLQKQFGYRLGRLQKTHQRYTYPLKFLQAKSQVMQNVILIGNAAHTLHPLAAQGLNIALREVNLISQSLIQAKKIAETELKKILPKNIVKFSHRLNQIFSTDFFLFNAGRQLSMVALDMCPLLKKQLAERLR